jgi:hypothetical protein
VGDHRLSNGGEADGLAAMRGPSESYSDVILRVAKPHSWLGA